MSTRVTVALSPEEVVAGIAGWEAATCTELSGGLNNRSWHVTTGSRSGVLKIDDGPREAPFNSRCAEANIQNRAAVAGLAPHVILADDGLYFTEYVAGVVWQPSCLQDDDNLELLAVALRRLHALPLSGRSFDARVAAQRYVESIAGLPADIVQQATGIIASMRLPRNLCCCHNDLVAENIITMPELMFLDWEYACDNDPFFDLATVIEHHELRDMQVRKLLDAYFDGDGERWREHLEQQRKLYLALLCLWMGSRTDSDPVALQQVAARLTTSDS